MRPLFVDIVYLYALSCVKRYGRRDKTFPEHMVMFTAPWLIVIGCTP